MCKDALAVAALPSPSRKGLSEATRCSTPLVTWPGDTTVPCLALVTHMKKNVLF